MPQVQELSLYARVQLAALMDRIEERCVPHANPCPSRAEWDQMRSLVGDVGERA